MEYAAHIREGMLMVLRRAVGCLMAMAVCFAMPAVALAQRNQALFGTWNVQKDGLSLEMYSANASGSTVGVMCVDGQSCSVYVASRHRCKDGVRYQGVVKADGNIADDWVTCRVVGDRFVYVLSDFARAIRGLRDTRRWGLVVEAEAGLMQVFHFSVSGTRDAIGAMALIDQGSVFAQRDEMMY